MKLDITEKKENSLLSRTEVKASIEFDAATPSNEQVKQELAKKLSADPELVIIKQIRTGFGMRKAGVTAYSYSKKEDMIKIERIKPPKEKKEGADDGKEEEK